MAVEAARHRGPRASRTEMGQAAGRVNNIIISGTKVDLGFRISLFLAVFGHRRVRGATTLNFGPISTKLGGIVRAIKKMTQKDNGPGPGRNYGEMGVFTFGRKVVFGLKMGLGPAHFARGLD